MQPTDDAAGCDISDEEDDEESPMAARKRYSDNDGDSEHTSTVANATAARTTASPQRGQRLPPPPRLPMLSIRNHLFDIDPPAHPEVAQANTRGPVPFGNQYFEGRTLLLLRTDPMDAFYASHFEGRRRMFEFQVCHALHTWCDVGAAMLVCEHWH